MSPKGYESHDFRDIEVLDKSTVVVLGISSPGVILTTKDNGKTWKEIYRDNDPEVFMDDIALVDAKIETKTYNFIVFRDSTKKQFPYLFHLNLDGDTYFYPLNYPVLQKGENFFAASGSNAFFISNMFYFWVTGGIESNLYYSTNTTQSLHRENILIIQGKESMGANSVTFNPDTNVGVIVGGNFTKPNTVYGNAIVFKPVNDYHIKFIYPETPPNGYRSCVDFISDNNLISCGINGVDLSKDGGLNWKSISKESYHVCKKSKNGSLIYLAGKDGKIGKFDINNYSIGSKFVLLN